MAEETTTVAEQPFDILKALEQNDFSFGPEPAEEPPKEQPAEQVGAEDQPKADDTTPVPPVDPPKAEGTPPEDPPKPEDKDETISELKQQMVDIQKRLEEREQAIEAERAQTQAAADQQADYERVELSEVHTVGDIGRVIDSSHNTIEFMDRLLDADPIEDDDGNKVIVAEGRQIPLETIKQALRGQKSRLRDAEKRKEFITVRAKADAAASQQFPFLSKMPAESPLKPYQDQIRGSALYADIFKSEISHSAFAEAYLTLGLYTADQARKMHEAEVSGGKNGNQDKPVDPAAADPPKAEDKPADPFPKKAPTPRTSAGDRSSNVYQPEGDDATAINKFFNSPDPGGIDGARFMSTPAADRFFADEKLQG